MAFSSIDDLVSEIGAGKRTRLLGQRTINTSATSAAGRWHDCFAGPGTGGAGVLTGTAGVGFALNSSTTGALPQPTATVTPDTKHLLSMMGVTPATTAVPAVLMLTDLLYAYPSCVVTGTPTVPNNGAAKPTRHNNGAGVQCSAVVATSALGAATPSLTVTYTDQGGVSGTGTLTASANSLPAGALLSGGAAAQLGSPFMQLAAGDSGVRQIDSYTIGSGTTGIVTFVLHRPIAQIPLVAANTAGERDFLYQMPSLPQIDDDACLAFLILIGGATIAAQVVTYDLMTAWG